MSERKARRRTWQSRPSPAVEAPASTNRTVDSLERLLHILPRASGPNGVALADLTRELGVEAKTVVSDLREVQDRDLYHASGGADDIQIDIAPDHVRVWSAHRFDRPTKLSPLEALALWVGLEVVRIGDRSGSGGDGQEPLAARLRRHLARQRDEEIEAAFAAPDIAADPGGVRHTLVAAAAECRPCVIRYVKPDAAEPDTRHVHPYVTVHAEGSWYLLARCPAADAVRTFRLDRVLEVDVGEGRFERPADFDPADHLDTAAGRALEPSHVTEAAVRYSPVIARWIAEREQGEWLEDGSYEVRHPVANPDWLVRHVLQYTGEAAVSEPAELRAKVREAALRVAESD